MTTEEERDDKVFADMCAEFAKPLLKSRPEAIIQALIGGLAQLRCEMVFLVRALEELRDDHEELRTGVDAMMRGAMRALEAKPGFRVPPEFEEIWAKMTAGVQR